MCVTAHVHIPVYTPVTHAPPMQQINALLRQVTSTHPVISLMAHTGVDIEQVICVTSTLLRVLLICQLSPTLDLLVRNNVSAFKNTNPTTSLCWYVLCLYLHAV